MCTSITLKSLDNKTLLARTMDFSFELEPEMILMPRQYPLSFQFQENTNTDHYAVLGLAKDVGKVLFADGINEQGFSGAALYFEGYAHYKDKSTDGRQAVAADELLLWALANFKSVSELISAVNSIDIVGSIVSFLGVIPPLHWIFADETGAHVIVESRKEGLFIYEDSIGVMTNSPDYDWHLTNVRNYIGLQPEQVEPRILFGKEFKAFGQSSGTFGLPGDFTPPSRFIRTLYNRLSCEKAANEHDLIINASHILNSVDIPKGAVVTQRATIDYTQYTSYMVHQTRTYAFRMYHALDTKTYKMDSYELDGKELRFL